MYKITFDKIQHPLMINIFKETRIENFLNIRKNIHKTTKLLNSAKLNVFTQRLVQSQGCQLSSLSFNIMVEVLSRALQERKIRGTDEKGKKTENDSYVLQ